MWPKMTDCLLLMSGKSSFSKLTILRFSNSQKFHNLFKFIMYRNIKGAKILTHKKSPNIFCTFKSIQKRNTFKNLEK